jgi:hypothetical protein
VLVDQLQSQRWSERRDTVTHLLAIPARDRSPSVIESVVKEIVRLQAAPDLGIAEVPRGEDLEAAWQYYADLVKIACGSTNPMVIEPLVKAVKMGNPVSDALARFGDAAAPQLLAAVKDRKEDPDLALMSLFTFRMMLERNPTLAPESREGIAALARRHLTGRQISVVVGRALDVAGELKDPTFVPALTRIEQAHSAEEAGLVLLDGAAFEIVRARARAALDRLRRWPAGEHFGTE